MTPSDKEIIQIQYTSTRVGIVEADACRVFRAGSGRFNHILHLLFQLLFQLMYDNESIREVTFKVVCYMYFPILISWTSLPTEGFWRRDTLG